MNINKYRKHYLACLHNTTYDENLDRTFPVARSPDKYDNWEKNNSQHYTKPVEITPTKVWVASDHHFDHANIIKYANRDFNDVPSMNQTMIDRHNAVVKPDDTIILGGDIAFCATNKANDFLDQLNGRKILIIGNHDWERKTGKLKKYNVDEIHMSYYVEVDGKEVLITHMPFHSTVMLLNENLYNLHGHIHDKLIPHNRYKNMCVEHIDYTPIKLSEVLT